MRTGTTEPGSSGAPANDRGMDPTHRRRASPRPSFRVRSALFDRPRVRSIPVAATTRRAPGSRPRRPTLAPGLRADLASATRPHRRRMPRTGESLAAARRSGSADARLERPRPARRRLMPSRRRRPGGGGSVHRAQPCLELVPRSRPARLCVPVLASAATRDGRLSLGLRRPEQRLPVRPRGRTVPATARPVRPGRSSARADGHLCRCERSQATYAGRVVEGRPADEWRLRLRRPGAQPSLTLQTCVGANDRYRLVVRLVRRRLQRRPAGRPSAGPRPRPRGARGCAGR